MQQVMNELREIMEDAFNSLLQAYLDDAPRRLERMHEAVAQNDLQGLIDEAHGLKGSSANLGAAELAEVCEQVVRAGREERLSDPLAALERIRQAYEPVAVFLEKELQREV